MHAGYVKKSTMPELVLKGPLLGNLPGDYPFDVPPYSDRWKVGFKVDMFGFDFNNGPIYNIDDESFINAMLYYFKPSFSNR